MISSLSLDEGSLVFDALNSGAFDYIQKPKLEDKEGFKETLSDKMLCAAESLAVKVVKNIKLMPVTSQPDVSFADNLLWCLGASTGGTQALTRVLTSLPAKIPATLIVQHIPPVFSKSFADSLNSLVPFTVKEAEDGEVVRADCAYVAPGGLQMGIVYNNGKLCISLRDSEPVNRFKPSVDYLFNEISKIKGFQIVAGILTGMGRDGSKGMLELKNYGAWTFAQNEESCAVYGMPRAAIESGATSRSIPLDEIAHELLSASQSFKKNIQTRKSGN